tara:strand:+ start:234 stop:467 length:234 start_codon:yes stop_codon:yes gene_type:complete
MTDTRLMRNLENLQALMNENEDKIAALRCEDAPTVDQLLTLTLTLAMHVEALSDALKEAASAFDKSVGRASEGIGFI